MRVLAFTGPPRHFRSCHPVDSSIAPRNRVLRYRYDSPCFHQIAASAPSRTPSFRRDGRLGGARAVDQRVRLLVVRAGRGPARRWPLPARAPAGACPLGGGHFSKRSPTSCQLGSHRRRCPPCNTLTRPLQVQIEFERSDGKVCCEVTLGDSRCVAPPRKGVAAGGALPLGLGPMLTPFLRASHPLHTAPAACSRCSRRRYRRPSPTGPPRACSRSTSRCPRWRARATRCAPPGALVPGKQRDRFVVSARLNPDAICPFLA